MSDTSAGLMPRESEKSGATTQSTDEISAIDLLTVLGKKKHVVLRTTVIAVVVGLLLAFLLPKEYTAEVTLLPPQQGSSLSSLLASQLGGLTSMASLAGHDLGLKNPNDMYVSLFKSRPVEDAMIRKYGLMSEYHEKLLSNARKAFEKHADVDGSQKDGMLHISVTDRNPERAADLANGYVEQYKLLSANLAITEAGQRRLFFQQQLDDTKGKLESAEDALKTYEDKNGVIQIDSQARALITSAVSLRAQISTKEVEIQGLRSYAADGNPELLQAQQELDGLRTQLAKLTGNSSEDGVILPKGKVPEESIEYLRKYRDVRYYETIFEILAKQLEMARLDEAKEGALVQVVAPAVAPDHKSSPHRALIIVGCLVAGFFVGILLALVLAGWEQLKLDPQNAAKIAELHNAFRTKHEAKS